MVVHLKGPLGSEIEADVYLSEEGIVLSALQLGDWGISWDDLAQIMGHPKVEDRVADSIALQRAWV